MTGPRTTAIDHALRSLAAGRPVLVLDGETRENEGDVVLAASHASARWIGWTVRHTSGVLCAPMPAERADALALPPMVADNRDPRGTAYTVSVDARTRIGTGISATDRARTLRLLAVADTNPDDLVRPGHVFPLRAVPGGVRERPGHTEAAVDLCRLAGLPPVGVIAELVSDDGQVMTRTGVRELGARSDLPVITIADIAASLDHDASEARPDTAPRLTRSAAATLPTRHGTFTVSSYRDSATGNEHLVLAQGDVRGARAVVRVHSECLTGDTFGSQRCDCGPQLDAALAAVARNGGVVIYLRGHEGRGIGLLAKLDAYALQDRGSDTVDANRLLGLPVDARDYRAAAAILADLGLDGIRLLTNNPAKVAAMRTHGITVTERLPIAPPETPWNHGYLMTKRVRMGHLLPTPARSTPAPSIPAPSTPARSQPAESTAARSTIAPRGSAHPDTGPHETSATTVGRSA